jgi:hypothetical protein
MAMGLAIWWSVNIPTSSTPPATSELAPDYSMKEDTSQQVEVLQEVPVTPTNSVSLDSSNGVKRLNFKIKPKFSLSGPPAQALNDRTKQTN